MLSSPPDEPEHIRRGRTLTPESPKPLHYPSPSNIPILEMQDPLLNEPGLAIGSPASFQYPQQTHTPGENLQNAGSLGATPDGYAHMAAYNGSMGAQAHDTSSIQNFATHQPPASSYSDATSAPARSAYPLPSPANAYQAQQSQTQAVPGDPFQLAPNATSVDVQAILDTLSTPANNTISSQYVASSMPPQPIHPQGHPSSSTLPAAPNLPARPPAQAKRATHPNYNPNDDIRSFHPHSSHRGSTQLQPLTIRGGHDESAMRSNTSPSTPAYGQRQSFEQGRSASPGDDDEDQRWPAHVNKQYEDFLDQERRFVTEGQWDQFPNGSRLFIGT